MTTPWCCLGFQSHYQRAGRRGTAILVETDRSGGPVFVLQFRSVEVGQQLPATDFPTTLCQDVQISYCPWCGVELPHYYGRVFAEMVRPGYRIGLPELDQ